VVKDYPWVWPEGRAMIGPDQIDATVSALWRAWGLMLAIVAVLAIF
jgi:adenosylcobinamide-phosphate synthase